MVDQVELRGYRFTRLLDSDLAELAAALDAPQVRRFVGDPHERYPARLAREEAGESLTIVAARDGLVAGTIGVFGYPGDPAVLQTATILAPAFFGSGLNKLGRVIQWQLGQVLGQPLVATIDVGNERSIAATRKLHPEITPEPVWEEWVPRQALLFRLTTPPVGVPLLDEAESERLAALAAGTPLWQRALS